MVPATTAPVGASVRRHRGRGDVAVRRGHASTRADFEAIVADAYATVLADPAVTPLVDLGDDLWLLELFHGPTLAFKDVALQLVGRLFDHELAPRGRARHHRRRDVGRHRFGRHRGLPRPRRHRHRRSCIPRGRVSEVQRRQMTTVLVAERLQRRHRRHVRRLPGPRQGDVRRRSVPRRAAAVGGQLHQLGARDGADRLLRRRRRTSGRSRRAASRSPCRPATSATCSPATARSRWASTSAVRRGLEPQRHPHAVLHRRQDDHRRGAPVAVAEHGHPGVVQPRAAAVRAARPRRRGDRAS